MLEFILNQLFFLGKIYVITGSLITLSFVFINYIIQDEEHELTMGESLAFIFFYPVILHSIFNDEDNE